MTVLDEERMAALVVDRRVSSSRVKLVGVEGFGVDERPVTSYAEAPDGVSIAYQVSGDGTLDLLFRPGMGIPIDLFWDEPRFVRFAKRLGGFSRVVMADFRGVGASGGDVRDSVLEAIGDSDV